MLTENKSGQIKRETLSQSDILDHELPHTMAQINGESFPLNSKKHTIVYPTDSKNEYLTESINLEEAAAMGEINRTSRKGIKYVTETGLRFEQNKTRRRSYNLREAKPLN